MHEVHIFYAELERPPEAVSELAALLAEDERERADRFRFERHRRRSVVRRGVLRRLLARFTGQDPAALRFAYGPKDKPELAGESAKAPEERLHFNLSDSEELAVYAVARGVEVGVDVEVLRPMPDALSISESFFSARERDVLRQVAPGILAETFFNCWTRKEAYLKAIGEGLSEPLDSFSVSMLPGEPARFLHFDLGEEEVAAWELHHLSPTAESVGALALRRHGFAVVEQGWV